MEDLEKTIVVESASLKEAIHKIDSSGQQVVLVVSADKKLLGILTDGDFRRAILKGKSLNSSVLEIMNPNPITAHAAMTNDEMLVLMRKKSVHHLPVVDKDLHLIDLVTIDELVGISELPNWIVLMAGGLGKRLRPYTNNRPKPLLEIGGKPIIEHIIEKLIGHGFKQFFLSVNYKAQMFVDYFGNGENWGVKINYLHENTTLGTGGGLSLLPESPRAPIIVMNGDLLTDINFDSLLRFHESQDSVATMAVREHDVQVPFGVVRFDGTQITEIDEKPVHKFFVNAGIYVLSPQALNYVPEQKYFDMPSLFEHLIALGQRTSAYPLREYWLDIGRIEEYEKARSEWRVDSLVDG